MYSSVNSNGNNCTSMHNMIVAVIETVMVIVIVKEIGGIVVKQYQPATVIVTARAVDILNPLSTEH